MTTHPLPEHITRTRRHMRCPECGHLVELVVECAACCYECWLLRRKEAEIEERKAQREHA